MTPDSSARRCRPVGAVLERDPEVDETVGLVISAVSGIETTEDQREPLVVPCGSQRIEQRAEWRVWGA